MVLSMHPMPISNHLTWILSPAGILMEKGIQFSEFKAGVSVQVGKRRSSCEWIPMMTGSAQRLADFLMKNRA